MNNHGSTIVEFIIGSSICGILFLSILVLLLECFDQAHIQYALFMGVRGAVLEANRAEKKMIGKSLLLKRIKDHLQLGHVKLKLSIPVNNKKLIKIIVTYMKDKHLRLYFKKELVFWR